VDNSRVEVVGRTGRAEVGDKSTSIRVMKVAGGRQKLHDFNASG
jgi:hypothetical protein